LSFLKIPFPGGSENLKMAEKLPNFSKNSLFVTIICFLDIFVTLYDMFLVCLVLCYNNFKIFVLIRYSTTEKKPLQGIKTPKLPKNDKFSPII
jgi:hypothetical protein